VLLQVKQDVYWKVDFLSCSSWKWIKRHWVSIFIQCQKIKRALDRQLQSVLLTGALLEPVKSDEFV
jgi:hypothetical protein